MMLRDCDVEYCFMFYAIRIVLLNLSLEALIASRSLGGVKLSDTPIRK